jgi:hypothetical protein
MKKESRVQPIKIIWGIATQDPDRARITGDSEKAAISESLTVLLKWEFIVLKSSTRGKRMNTTSMIVERSFNTKKVSKPGLSRLGDIRPMNW